MSELIKIVITVFCAVILLSVIKNIKPEYSFFVCIACALVILCFSVPKLIAVITKFKNMLPFTQSSFSAMGIFFKCVVICEVCSLTKSFCADSSNNFLSSCVDIAEKTAVLAVAMPLIESVIKIIVNFIGT